MSNTLEECLRLLYNYLGNFLVSIDLIQRLAQQLKLETFVDKLGFSLNLSKNDDAKTMKLTIAGTTIMIDIDFTTNKSVATVVLLSASQEEALVRPDTRNSESYAVNDNVIKLDWTKNELSFLKQLTPGESLGTVAETILINNLTGDRLGYFPNNLQYLANIDQLSSATCDLFVYIERISLMLRALLLVEIAEEQWLTPYHLAVGAPSLNDIGTSQLGIYVNYWQDFRHLNHLAGSLVAGKNHAVVVLIDAASSQPDYLNDAREWTLANGVYNLEFDATSSHASSPWSLKITLSTPTYVPSNVLTYFGWKYTTAKSSSKFFDRINKGIIQLNNDDVAYNVLSQPHLGQWLAVQLVVITKLTDLARLIPMLRTCHLVATLIGGSIKKHPANDRRRSRALMAEELSEDAKKKLKELLKLPNDVTDEELLGLTAVQEPATYLSMLLHDDIDVDHFLQEEDTKETPTDRKVLSVHIVDIDFNSPFVDFCVAMSGRLGSAFATKLHLSNGVLTVASMGAESGMEVEDPSVDRLVKGLNLTEDLWKTVYRVYQ